MKRAALTLLLLLLPSFFLAQAKASRPNFVVFQVDDMPKSFLGARYLEGGRSKPLMPNLERYFMQGGTNFTDFAATSPLCAPSRAAFLTGQYPHSNRLVSLGGDMGGALGWMRSEAENNNLLTRLQERGYLTGHFGKWTNYYGTETEAFLPRGWDIWVTDATDKSTRDFYGYKQRWVIPRLQVDRMTGKIGQENYSSPKDRDSTACRVETASAAKCRYHTDLMTRMAGEEIQFASKPFYMQIDYHAPHGDHVQPAGPQVASRHEGLINRVILPARAPNFNESDISDKAYPTQEKSGLLTPANVRGLDSFARHALMSLRSVDEGIGHIIQILEKKKILNNTYLVFLSDNGFFYGNHRFLLGKTAAHEESSKIPFLMRGPGLPRGNNPLPASTIDFAPTVTDLAGARPLWSDGESIISLLRKNTSTRPRLIEMVSQGELTGASGWNSPLPVRPLDPARPAGSPPGYRYRALQIGSYKYLAYDRGGEELYDLKKDPFEMNSLASSPAAQDLLLYMRRSLDALRFCRGFACRSVSGSPPPLK